MKLPLVQASAPVSVPAPNPERISIELTNQCSKACWFCYNHSQPSGDTRWTPDEVVSFILDCSTHGTRAVSFGGGEPLQYPGLFEILTRLKGRLFRSLTSNGLLLTPEMVDRLTEAEPDKIHLSIHFPERETEVKRVIEQVEQLAQRGIKSGINLLVARSHLTQAEKAGRQVREAGIGNERIVYLPMRGQDTPTPEEMARVAGSAHFQSMSCLLKCGPSPRFCSIGWDRSVAWCSYTVTRRPLPELTFAGLQLALTNLGLTFCGGTDGH